MTRGSVSKLKLGEKGVYIRRQPCVCVCVCVCACARAGWGGQSLCVCVCRVGRSEFVQVGPSSMGAKGLESKMGQEVMFMREGQQQ